MCGGSDRLERQRFAEVVVFYFLSSLLLVDKCVALSTLLRTIKTMPPLQQTLDEQVALINICIS